MTRDEIETLVKQICSDTLQVSDINIDSNFSDDLGGDSLDFMGVMLEIEDKLEISFGNSIVELNSGNLTVKDIIDLTEKTLNNHEANQEEIN